jgi:hypothetical protein
MGVRRRVAACVRHATCVRRRAALRAWYGGVLGMARHGSEAALMGPWCAPDGLHQTKVVTVQEGHAVRPLLRTGE